MAEPTVNTPHEHRVARAMRSTWHPTPMAWLAALIVGAGAASAQPAPHRTPAPIEDILPLTNDPNDPIGLDAEQNRLDTIGTEPAAATKRAVTKPEPAIDPPPSAARSDAVLVAVQQVHETAHRVTVDLDMGLAQVTTTLVLESRGGKPAEVELRLPTPEGAVLAALQVCNSHGCSTAPIQATKPELPGIQVHTRAESTGTRWIIRAAPVAIGDPLTLTLTSLAPAPQHGGVARLRLPARGMDPRIAPTQVSLRVHGLEDARIDDLPAPATAVPKDPWTTTELSARATAGATLDARIVRTRCGGSACSRAYVAVPPRAAAPVDLVLAIDASPSMEGPARSRLLTTLSTILAAAPEGSRVRALMFAARAQVLVGEAHAPDALSLQALSPASYDSELGSATRFEAAWDVISGWKLGANRLRKVVVLVGDGGVTTGPARPFEQAKRAGVEVSVVNVADRRSTNALARGAWLTRGVVIDAGPEADDAVRGLGDARLQERIAALFAPTAIARFAATGSAESRLVAPSLRAGESVAFTGAALSVSLDGRRLRATPPSGPLARSLLATGAGSQSRASTTATDGSKTSADPGIGMPASPLLSMLQQRVMPVARGCFRRDRAGRADYQVRATFVFTLAEREVVAARVEGAIAEALRTCLLQAVDTLAVPRFSGLVVVRYPLVTEREPLPSQVKLSGHTEAELDAVISEDSKGLPQARP